MSNLLINKFKSRDDLMHQLQTDILRDLGNAIEQDGRASMLLSGGTTPGELYGRMSGVEFDWQKVTFAPTDERWVEPDSDDSNEKLIRQTLLVDKAASARYISLKSQHPDPVSGQFQVEQELKKIKRPFDVILLGMGEDGHTASLFPGIVDTEKAFDTSRPDLCHPIRRGAGEVDRMTMTLKSLLSGKRIFILFFGNKKFDVFQKASIMKNNELPISLVICQNEVPVSLYWSE